MAVRDGVEGLSEDELMGTITLIFVAGFITTSTLIGNGLVALARHPGETDRLWTQPGLVPGAVEEMLRYDAPAQFDRTVLADTEVNGRALPAGRGVVVLPGAANRDPGPFPDPDRFDLSRRDAHLHLSFAWGLHHCLGASPASQRRWCSKP
ncbi:MAG: cytochrome P450 [Actinomycetota bacterium]